MSKGRGAPLQKDAPWRAAAGQGVRPIPKIHHSPILRIQQTPFSTYAISLIKCVLALKGFEILNSSTNTLGKHPNPIGSGLAHEAIVEAAGPECIVPGQTVPIKLLGLKVWPIDVDLKFMEPVGRELKSIGKFMDAAVDLMGKSTIDR